jgi:hypothetical protein
VRRLLILVAAAGTAHAEGERALSGDAGLATFSALGKKVGSMAQPQLSPDIGFTLGGSFEYMIGADFALRAEGAGTMFTGGEEKDESSLSYAVLGGVGAAFRFDVLKYVPYAFVGVGGMATFGGPIDRGANLMLSVGGGLDVLQSRERSYGGELRIASFGGDVTIVTLSFRASCRWGFF